MRRLLGLLVTEYLIPPAGRLGGVATGMTRMGQDPDPARAGGPGRCRLAERTPSSAGESVGGTRSRRRRPEKAAGEAEARRLQDTVAHEWPGGAERVGRSHGAGAAPCIRYPICMIYK